MSSSPPAPLDGATPDDHLGADAEDASSRRRNLADLYSDVEPGPLPPLAPDGGFAALPLLSVPIPAATPENFVCLRGPCRHYWQMSTFIDVGNPAGTFGSDGLRDPLTGTTYEQPRQIHRTCLAAPGVETDLTEATVYECSLWDPRDPDELVAVQTRRANYYRTRRENP